MNCIVTPCHMCGDPEYHESFPSVPVFVACDQAGCGAPRDVIQPENRSVPDVPPGCCRYCGNAVEYCGC